MDQAASEIRERILDLRLRPGQRLDDIGIAAEIGLSRTPVREALFHLSSEGLVEVGPRGGFTVRGLELMDIRELFEAHSVLARSVARLVAMRASESDLAALEDATEAVDRAVASADPGAIASSNARLHQLEARVARNEYLHILASRIHLLGQRLSYLSFGGAGALDGDMQSHYRQISAHHAHSIDFYRARDADGAERTAAEHVDLFRRRIMAFIDSGGLDGVSLQGFPS